MNRVSKIANTEARSLQPGVSLKRQSGRVMLVVLLAILGLAIAAFFVKPVTKEEARDDPKVFGGGAPGR
jgi:hypothetical protein